MIRDKNKQKISEKVVNKTKTPKRNNTKNIGRKSSSGIYYSFLTVVLLLCLVQITLSAVLNISKIVSYKAKIVQITKTRDSAKALNEQLKDNIKNFSNASGLEAIARNNLKMSGEDEVLVIINTPKEELREEKVKIINLKKQTSD